MKQSIEKGFLIDPLITNNAIYRDFLIPNPFCTSKIYVIFSIFWLKETQINTIDSNIFKSNSFSFLFYYCFSFFSLTQVLKLFHMSVSWCFWIEKKIQIKTSVREYLFKKTSCPSQPTSSSFFSSESFFGAYQTSIMKLFPKIS